MDMPRKCNEFLWKEYFKDPSQWWDNRSSKIGPAHPDFKHKVSKEPLWIDGRLTPSWVPHELRRRDLLAPSPHGPKDQAPAFVALLRACTKSKDLRRGTLLHHDILRLGLLAQCSDALVTMYAKCGSLAKAKELFDMHHSKDVLTWTALIAGYAQNGQGHDALHYYDRMQCEGLSPDAVTYSCILKACGSIRAPDKGELIHDKIAKEGLLGNNIVLGTALVDMYAKCGALMKAQQVLEGLSMRNVISWTALIAGYVEHGKNEQALNCFELMQREGLFPDSAAFICTLKACGSIGAADSGEKIHNEIAKQGLLSNDIVLGTALVDMYAKCGALAKAQKVLDELHVRDAVSWNALITGYVEHGKGEQALLCFERMQHEGISPDAVTFICILKACGSIGAFDKGEKVHEQIAKQGLLGDDIVIGNAVVDMYAKCGAFVKARGVLDQLPFCDVISWNALISGYVEHGKGEQALNCFDQMQREGLCPDATTFICILKACGSIQAADKGEKIHEEISKHGLLGNNVLLGTALVDMYAKCSELAKARRVLEELSVRDVISWNALITRYVEHSEGAQALNCFERMQRDGLSPDAATYIGILKACGSIGAADKGEGIHDEIAKQGLLVDDIELGNALVDMYAKCGALAKARQVLDELPVRDVISWNALIDGYAQQCKGAQALNCFEQMQCEGLSPDAATFSSVLSACSRSGLVEDGQTCFVSMDIKHGVKPDLEHYTCMVDLFGRAGHLDKAVQVIEKMPLSTSVVWCALLGACQKWGDVEVGRWAFDHAVQVDRRDSAFYVLMAQIYAAAGMQQDAKNIEAMRIENKAWKRPADIFWLDTSGTINSFSVGDMKHAQSSHIYAKLEDLMHQLSKEGCSPNLYWVSQNVPNDANDPICSFCDKLALACALINTPKEAPVHIVQNMPICGDCHVATSLISKIEKRKIVVRDAKRRHDFEGGKCSCGDHWGW